MVASGWEHLTSIYHQALGKIVCRAVCKLLWAKAAGACLPAPFVCGS